MAYIEDQWNKTRKKKVLLHTVMFINMRHWLLRLQDKNFYMPNICAKLF